MTPILPPAIAELIGTSASTPKPPASSSAAASVKSAADVVRAASPASAEPEHGSSPDQPGQSAQRASYLWPSQSAPGNSQNVKTEDANAGLFPDGKAAAEQEIEVEELEWKPEEAAGPSAGNTVEALPAQIDERREASPPLPQARYDITPFMRLLQADTECACRHLLGT